MSQFFVMRYNCMLCVVVLCGVFIVFVGCICGMFDLCDWVVKEKFKKGVLIDLLLVICIFEIFEYSDQGDCDLFSFSFVEMQLVLMVVVLIGLCLDENCVKQLLEMFVFDSFKMVGMVGIGVNIEVLIKDLGGVIYCVYKNEYMGQNYG